MMKQNRITNVLTITLAVMTWVIASTNAMAGTVVSETFSGSSATNLVGATTPDGNDWLGASNTDYKQDGSATVKRSAYLPFTLTQGLIYTLTVDLNPGGGGNWFAGGFAVNAGHGGTTAHQDGTTTPYGWMLLPANGNAQSFTGGNTTGGASMNSWSGNTATIVLNTTSASDYTVEWFDGSGSRRGPVSIGTPALDHVFIANESVSGTFDNLTLSDDSVPATPGTLIYGK